MNIFYYSFLNISIVFLNFFYNYENFIPCGTESAISAAKHGVYYYILCLTDHFSSDFLIRIYRNIKNILNYYKVFPVH